MEAERGPALEDFNRRLIDAFRGVELPEQITPCGCGECERLTERLQGRHWQTMEEDDFPIYQLCLLSGETFRFLLPGLLRYGYAHPGGEAAGGLYEAMNSEAKPGEDGETDRWSAERHDPLTPGQAALVLEVLQRLDPEVFAAEPEGIDEMHDLWRRRAMPSETPTS